MHKFTYRFEFRDIFVAGAATKSFLPEGTETAGRHRGEGWGSTPAKAKRRAKATAKMEGNCSVEWVLGETRLYKNGILIKETS